VTLAWVGFQYFGTNVISGRHQEQLRSDLRAAWASTSLPDGQPGGPAPSPRSTTSAADSSVLVADGAFALIRIPRFGTVVER